QGRLAQERHGLWTRPERLFLDPRTIDQAEMFVPSLHDPSQQRDFVGLWTGMLAAWREAGVSGVRCHDAAKIPWAVWAEMLQPSRDAVPGVRAMGWLPEASWEQKRAAGGVFDYLPSSVAWWDGTAPWLAEEYAVLGKGARLLGFPEDPFAA